MGDANATSGNWFSWNGVGSNGTRSAAGPVLAPAHECALARAAFARPLANAADQMQPHVPWARELRVEQSRG